MKTKMSLQAVDSVLDSKVDVNGVNLVTTKFEGMDMNTLKEVADNLRDKLIIHWLNNIDELDSISKKKNRYIVEVFNDMLDSAGYDILK